MPDDKRTLTVFELGLVCLPSGTIILVNDWRDKHPGSDFEFRKSLVDLVSDGYLKIVFRAGGSEFTESLSDFHNFLPDEIQVAFIRV